MKNGDKTVGNANFHSSDGSPEFEPGLTKREYFAGLAMQGMVSAGMTFFKDDIDALVTTAVTCADRLLEKLEKTS